MTTAARTILQLQEQLAASERERRKSLLAQAEMEHELNMLRAMRRDITRCVTAKVRMPNPEHRVNRVARILRNASEAA